jgi:hypothetical protein
MPEELLDEGNALGYIRAEHERIRGLLGSVWQSDEPEFTKATLVPLLLELKAHNAMERQIFFPFCQERIRPVDRLERGTAESMAIEEFVARLEGMDPTDASFRKTLEDLIHSFQRHCFLVDENLLVLLEGQDWQMHNDLVRCRMEMESLRERMLSGKLQNDEVRNPEFESMQHRRAQEQGRRVWPGRDVVPEEQLRGDREGAPRDVDVSTEGDVINMGGKTQDLSEGEDRSAGR